MSWASGQGACRTSTGITTGPPPAQPAKVARSSGLLARATGRTETALGRAAGGQTALVGPRALVGLPVPVGLRALVALPPLGGSRARAAPAAATSSHRAPRCGG